MVRSNVRFFALIAASLFAAMMLVALLAGGEIVGPKVAFNGSHHVTTH
jgi:hypothetical protein